MTFFQHLAAMGQSSRIYQSLAKFRKRFWWGVFGVIPCGKFESKQTPPGPNGSFYNSKIYLHHPPFSSHAHCDIRLVEWKSRAIYCPRITKTFEAARLMFENPKPSKSFNIFNPQSPGPPTLSTFDGPNSPNSLFDDSSKRHRGQAADGNKRWTVEAEGINSDKLQSRIFPTLALQRSPDLLN